MIAHLLCWLTGGHDYTTIAWTRKVWREKACLRCDRRKRNGQIPKVPMPAPLRRVK